MKLIYLKNLEEFAEGFAGKVQDLLNLKANLESPEFTGEPKAPTPPQSSNGTRLATTAFVTGVVSGHDASPSAHDDMRQLISGLAARLNALADSDDTTLDQLSEIVAYIKNNKSLIDGVTTSKVSVSDIIDNLTSAATNKPLSAKQGKTLKDLIDALTATVGNKVDKISGKGLSANDFTDAEKSKLAGVAANANNYSLPLAASGTRGGVKTGYAQNGKNYPVQLSEEKMYVNVPWTDTNTWRGIQNNLTSGSTTDSLSAAMGKSLKESVDALSDRVGSIAGGNDINEITDAAIDGIISGTYSE